MNILVIAHYGIYEDYTFSFIHAQAKEYAAKGHRVRSVVPVAWGKYCNGTGNRFGTPVQKRTVDGVEIMYLRVPSFSNLGDQLGLNTSCAIAVLRVQMPKILKDFKADVVHAHTFGTDSELGSFVKEMLGIPLVVTTHGSDTFVPYRENRKAELKRLGEKADQVVAVSSLLKSRLLDCAVTTPIQVILNGFHTQHVRNNNAIKSLHSLLQVGHLIERKKTAISISALGMVHQAHPGATFIIIGQGPERQALEQQTRELGVANSVQFLGQIPNDQVLTEMAKAQFFVMPSVREGFGIVYLEAMASGCINIGTEGEGIADLIVSGENGFLVPPDDPGAIARVIKWCLSHPAEAETIAARGREAALALTWECNARQYLILFETLLKNKQT